MTFISFISPYNKIVVNTTANTVKINNQEYDSDVKVSYLSNEKGRMTVHRFTIKYLGDILTLYNDKQLIDTCTRVSDEVMVEQGKKARTFYMTSTKSLEFFETDQIIRIGGEDYPITHVNLVGVHMVHRTEAGKLNISIVKQFPSTWNGINLLEQNSI